MSPSIPFGTVTFLFTDIEGSTQLFQKHPEAMKSALARHHAILRQAIESHDGYIAQISGDSFIAAFHTAPDALAAALTAQRNLSAEPWIETGPICVRMGLHVGTPEVRVEDVMAGQYSDYTTLARTHRIMSTGHGGQILLSLAVTELIRERLPADVTLRDMGQHRLKGLTQPEHLFQVVAPDLPADFPPITSLTAFPNKLPIHPTPFIGRQAEMKTVKDLLVRENVHLVTLTGPGGTGKTRLALQAVADLIDHFEDGVYFVDLAPIHDPGSVLAAIARTVGLREMSDRPLIDELKEQLRAKKLLLLLDNFEQVMAAGPKVVELLRDCSKLKLLMTSREALHMRGEYVFPVPPLALPRGDLKQPSIEQLTQFEAVKLFIERALAVKPDFTVTNDNAPEVAEICVRLDGLPLAIELAAARISLFSPHALLERVGSRLKLLRGGARDLPLRQQTLRDTIDWSYELLDTGEQRLFALFSVFLGCKFEAVEAVASGIKHLDETGVDILDGLASLVDKSLVRQVDQGIGEPRLLMLETIREYATERLEEDHEFSAAARRAHAAYFADFTQRQWERLNGHGREAALEEMESDIENVRTAWRYWRAEGNLEQLRKLTDCLWLLYDARGWYHAMVDSTADLLNVLASTPSTPERAQEEIMLRISLARALMAIKGCTQEVEEAYNRALELCQGQGEIPQLFPVLRGLSTFYVYVGDFEKGARMGERILNLAERNDDASMRVEGHLVLGYNLAFLGELSLGLDHLEKAIASYDPDRDRLRRFRLGSNPGVVCFTTTALVLWMLGFPDRALERANDAIALAKRLNHPFSLAYALFHTGLLHLWMREAELINERSKAVLDIAENHEFQIWRAVAICLHGAALAGMGQAEEGLMQINRGMDLYQGMKTPPVFWPLLLFVQAGACGLAGRPAEGLLSLDEAMKIVGQGSGNPLSSGLCLLKGDLLLALSPENPAEAEAWFLEALEVAQKRQARMMELQAAMSLCRLWRCRGKAEEGRRLLSDVYGRFTEGFTTADLKEARALLADLS
jgi:predicted ATPase/class 3 adenylate cyclase